MGRAEAAMHRLAIVAVALVTFTPGCGGPLREGEDAFRKGWYPQAKQSLAGLEAESRSWDDATRAEYALYRGLTLSALGDRGAAAGWLREAKSVEDAHPGALLPSDVQRLAASSTMNLLP
jgi:hypothetical protein